MQNLTSIVVGIDFTPGSKAALSEALRIARWNRATVRCVHVIDTLVAIELEEAMSEFQSNVRESLIADAGERWKAFAASVDGAAGVPLSVRIDNRTSGILAVAREAKADLLVLGVYGMHEPEGGLGMVATTCVRHALCKVLLVRDSQPGPFTSVVACVDFSPTSLAALDEAARVATQDGAALHVLHVFDAPWHQLHYRAPTPQATQQFQQQYRHGLQGRLVHFAKGLGREIDYLKPIFAIVDHEGHRSGIIEYAQKAQADLIVLGTRGRTNLRDMLMGGTAEKVLRESSCSVLAVKPEGFTHPLATGEGVSTVQLRADF